MVPEALAHNDAGWREALPFYLSRAPVIFYSSERFWDRHGFVQQSLARALVGGGVRVRWVDGSGWRPYRPYIGERSPLLRVGQLSSLPGRRFQLFDHLNVHLQWRSLRRMLRREEKPLFWVQAGIDERLAEALPPVDVYSVFDDPYSHSLDGALCRKARLILCQNSHATRLFRSDHGGKTHLALPPMELDGAPYDDGVFEPPPGFPKRLMGYIGSFFGAGFDFSLLEYFVRTLPDWGFVLMGRSDDSGDKRCEELSQYRNFLRLPWAPRRQTALLWRRLSVTLLLYPRYAQQDGAFATKAVESLRFGVPCIGTQVPKTDDLRPVVECSSDRDELVRLALVAAERERNQVRAEGDRFATEMEPHHYLARVARLLQGC